MSYSNKKNMKFCRSCTTPGAKCHGKGRCNFAHTIDEVKPDKCPYGSDCRARYREGRLCGYIHTDESKQDYADRHGFHERNKIINKSNTCHKGFKRLTALEFANMVTEKIDKYPAVDHLTNVGAKIMEKYGWEFGQGLGKNSQGILLPVKPVPPSKTMLNELQREKGPTEKVEFVRELLPELCFKLNAISL